MVEAAQDKNNNIPQIKIILLGEQGVGKTNLINVSIGKEFEETSSTLITNYSTKDITIDGKEYRLNLWDTVGQEKFRSLTKMFYSNSKIIILVYDKSAKETFDKLSFWVEEIKNIKDNDYVLAVVGNKEDLEDKKSDVNENEAQNYANSINAKFRLVSAKCDRRGFIQFIRELVKEYLVKNKIIPDENRRITIDKIKLKEKKSCKC